jgi:hypothetical protein
MKYIKYNVELNNQLFSIELPEIDWFLGYKLKSNKIPFTKENIEEEKEKKKNLIIIKMKKKEISLLKILFMLNIPN